MAASERITRGLCRLSEGSTLIEDADEEVFLLYTELAGRDARHVGEPTDATFRGLGFLDSRQDILTLSFDVNLNPANNGHGRAAGKTNRKRDKGLGDLSFEVQLAQDKTALRTRKGDTGSVLWRASAELAQLIVCQHFTSGADALLDPAMLQNAHTFELGAGTGLLAIALSRIVLRYTATDIADLVPLIRKNLTLNLPEWENITPSSSRIKTSASTGPKSCHAARVQAQALDWLELQKCPPKSRRPIYSLFSYDPIDLLLVVDCIYHPSLLPALVETIDHLSTPERTAVLVVVELRAEDVIREFLELWLDASGRGTWEIWHVSGFMESGPYAAWVGWKKLSRD
ncbi:putative methyltransferase-domain-containing protein [Cristinia sonorae]|uniref:Methyltransferase-domain-containing protein n=1 Tax=Cristinia sonorae TaxID=1940300 RepID=A0A8K0UDT0_9AGAR|nr:putative methyltransferase-domain-containing protein [Cristinia sonorae]